MSDVTAVPLRPVGRSGVVALWAGVAVLLCAGLGTAYATSAGPRAMAGTAAEFLAWNAKRPGVHTTMSGLQYQVLKAGEGAHPGIGDAVQVDYVGKLSNGTVFDASPPQQPAAFPVAAVVPGFSEALQLMARGGRYRIWIPPQLGYGDHVPPGGPIPANAALVFDVVLHDFRPMPQQAQVPGLPGM